jgi:hypothetical protein
MTILRFDVKQKTLGYNLELGRKVEYGVLDMTEQDRVPKSQLPLIDTDTHLATTVELQSIGSASACLLP